MAKGFRKVVLVMILVFLAIGEAIDMAYHNPKYLVGFKKQDRSFDVEDLAASKQTPEAEKEPGFWYERAFEAINQKTSHQRNLKKAKNLIFFLGDGMSLSTLTAARILKGQRQGRTGEEERLSFEKFPYTGLSKTYCANAQVPDSACTATAYLCGVKTNIVNIGVSANVSFADCAASLDSINQVSSIAEWAQNAGKSTGFVTTTTLTHASPAGAYAHTPNRMWECDTDFQKYSFGFDIPENCMDIATQLITQKPGKHFEIMMGGGMGKFLPKTMIDSFGNPGERSDKKNLLSKWQQMHPKGAIATTRDQLLKLNTTSTSHFIGLFESGLMNYHLKADPKKQPTLAEMTEVALRKLSRNSNGYFVFIEGGLIDYGNHDNKAAISLDETLEFEKAIQLARGITDPEDTLIVVTADHAHPLSISGYPGRGNDILGLNQNDVDNNGVKYMTLNYAVGTDQKLDNQCHRRDLTNEIDGDPDFVFPSYIAGSMGMGNHAGDDVGIFASGPFEHLFSGSLQQSEIPHLMAYAACIGNGPKMCDQ